MSKPLRSASPRGWVVGAAVVIVVAIWALWAKWGVALVYQYATGSETALFTKPVSTESMAAAGQVGDLFGGINALFAALALVGIAWAGWLQAIQLRDAREAYDLEREANKQREDEAFFFQLVSIVTQMKADLVFRVEFAHLKFVNADEQLRNSADDVVHDALRHYIAAHQQGDYYKDVDAFGELRRIIEDILRINASTLEPFFRVVIQLFDWLNEPRNISDEKKTAYADIARAQLSGGLATMLGIFALRRSNVHLFQTVEDYGLLEHVIARASIRGPLRTRYSSAAFGVDLGPSD